MGCGASAQVGADEENGSQADGNDLQGDNFQSQTAEADGYHHDGLEVGGVDNMSSPYVQPGGAAPLDKTPLPPIRRSTAVDTKSIHSDNFDVGSEQSGTIIFARPKTGMPSFRSPRKLPKLIGGRTPILDNNISDGIANDETIILPASEQNENPDTEDKATNTLKIVEESDEDDISFGQMADDANIGVRRDAEEEEENEEQNGEEENVDDQNGEEQNDEEQNVEQENIEQENIETNNEGIDDFDDVPLENANEEEEIEQGQTEVVEELDANAADIEAELEEQMEKAESVNENKEEDFLGEAPPDEVDQPPDESEEIEEDNIVPVQAGNHHKVSLTVIDDIENDETEAPDKEVADQPADPEDEPVEPEIDQPIGNDVNAEQGNEDEDDDDDAGVVYTPAPSRPTSSGSRRTLQIEAASRQSSRLSTVGGNNNVMNDSSSRPNSATSLAKLSTASHRGSLASLKEVSTASRRGSSASGGTKGDVEDEVDVEEERRSTSRKKVASANRVRIAEGHQLMETPSPLPNDSGADLEADEDGDSKPVDDKGRGNDEENDESGMENQDSDFSQDIPITNLANISRSSSVQVTG